MAVTPIAQHGLLLALLAAGTMSACANVQETGASPGIGAPVYDMAQLRRARDDIHGHIVTIEGYLDPEPTHFGLWELSAADGIGDGGRRGRCSGEDGKLIGVEFRKGRAPDPGKLAGTAASLRSRRVILSGRFDKAKIEIGVNGLFIDYDASLRDATILKYEDSWCGDYPKAE